MTKNAVTIKVPGKLFVAGEYAVTRPGGKALVAAIETNFFVTVSARSDYSRLTTNVAEIPDYDFKLSDFEVAKESPWTFALAALKNMSLRENQEIEIAIQSDLGYGEHKKGYGSSASVVVGVVNAVNRFFDLGLSLKRRFKIAGGAHRAVQGSGSLGDVASILYGGLIYYEAPGTKIQAVNWPWQETYVVKTGKSVKTHEKLAIQLSGDFYKTSDELVEKMIHLTDFQDFRKQLTANQQLLLTNLPEGYMTEKLAFALTVLRAYPWLAAKISGSGFGENLIVFNGGEEEAVLKEVREKLALSDLTLERINLAKSEYD